MLDGITGTRGGEAPAVSSTAFAVLRFLEDWQGEGAPTLRQISQCVPGVIYDTGHASYTLKRLVQLGLVDDYGPGGRRLTDAGRAALAEAVPS